MTSLRFFIRIVYSSKYYIWKPAKMQHLKPYLRQKRTISVSLSDRERCRTGVETQLSSRQSRLFISLTEFHRFPVESSPSHLYHQLCETGNHVSIIIASFQRSTSLLNQPACFSSRLLSRIKMVWFWGLDHSKRGHSRLPGWVAAVAYGFSNARHSN